MFCAVLFSRFATTCPDTMPHQNGAATRRCRRSHCPLFKHRQVAGAGIRWIEKVGHENRLPHATYALLFRPLRGRRFAPTYGEPVGVVPTVRETSNPLAWVA